MDNGFYKRLIEKSPSGYAYHKIICDEEGIPCDYEFIEANDAFERLTGFKCSEIIGKKITDILPDIKKCVFDWIKYCGDIALNGGEKEFEQVVEPLNKWYRGIVYSPKKSYFVTHIIDISKEKGQLDEINNFFEVNLDLLCIADIEGNFLKTSKAWESVLGYSADELYKRNFVEFVHPDDMESALESIAKIDGQTEVIDFVNRYLCKDGSYRWIECHARSEGKLIYAAARDITKRKEAEEEIKRKSSLINWLIDSIPDLIFYKDIKGVYLGCNPNFAKFVGKPIGEIIGKNDCDIFGKEIGDFFRNHDQEMLKQKMPRYNDEWVTYPDGVKALFDTMKTPYWGNDGELIGILGISRDISERKNQEAKLQESELRFNIAIEGTGASIWDYDILKKEFVFSFQCKKMLGYEEDEMENTFLAWKNLWHPDDVASIKKTIDDYLTGKTKKYKNIYRCRHKDGHWRWIIARGMILKDSRNKPYRWVGTNIDITEVKQAEIDLFKAKEQAEAANVAKSHFLANMSHEIRTPINGIFGFLELLQTSNLSSDQKEFIREAKSASTVLLNLINGILDVSKIEAGKLIMENIRFNLRTAVEDAVSLLGPMASEKDLELYTMIKAGVPEEVICDPSRLKQILNNLISNAVKFTESGEVSVTVDCTQEEEEEIAVLRFEVKDTGIGISKEALQKLFQSFSQADASTTRKYGGTGLGLVISKELVKIMGGKICVESIPGEGSIFKFTVRMKIAKRTSEQKTMFANLDGGNILIIDDHVNNRKTVKAYLQQVGLKVFESKDPGSAINTIISNAGTKNKINIALINYEMPGISVYDFAAALKKIPFAKDIKLILFTSASQKGEGRIAKEYGFSGYLSTPVRRDDLLNCMAIVLGLKKEEQEDQSHVKKHTVKEAKNVSKPRILLVEDNKMNRKIVIKMLESQDITCDVALDGREAYGLVQKKNYDIIFMDCQMPIMDGYESTAKIRADEGVYKHTTIIAMTANAMEGDRQKCIEAGMDDYISKPIDFDNMFKLIEANTKKREQNLEKFDWVDDHIDRFVESTGLKRDDVKELFVDFVYYLSKLLKAIEESIDTNDFEKMGELAHQLKGSSGNLRINSILQLVVKFEGFIVKQDKENCERVFEELKQLFF